MLQCRISSFEDLMLVRLTGRCTFGNMNEFDKVLESVGQTTPAILELEMSGLEYLDSSGIGMLLMLQELCEKQQTKLVLKQPVSQVLQLLQMIRLDKLFIIEE